MQGGGTLGTASYVPRTKESVPVFRRTWFGLAVCFSVAAGTGLLGLWKGSRQQTVPSAEVRLGEFVEYLELRGEIRPRSSTVITAPFNAGDLLILKLCSNGASVQKGEVIVQFDPTALQRTLEQSRSTLKQVDAEIERLKAQQRMAEERSLTDVMKARYDIERARLMVDARDVLTPLEIEKSRLELAKAEQKLREVEAKITSDRAGASADTSAIQRRRAKALLELELAEASLARLTLQAPEHGIVTLLPNYRASSTLGRGAPLFKEGDRTYAGAEIAELPELSAILVRVPVAESDRGRLQSGQEVSVRVDAVPDKEHQGVVEEIGLLAKLDFSSWPTRKSFNMTIRLASPDTRLRPGMSATARVAVRRQPNSILVPVGAVFEKDGRTIAYVQDQGRFAERVIEVTRRGGGEALVGRGLNPGERVALKDPMPEGNRN
jgi:HlyD family secretion protein